MFKRSALVLFLFIFVAGFIGASSLEAATMDEVLRRLDHLEKENRDLRREVESLKQTVRAGQTAEKKTVQAVGKGIGNVTAKGPVNIEIYGYVKADAVFSDSAGDVILMNAPSETSQEDDDEFNITANETRLGFNIDGVDIGSNGRVSGKIEGDFWASTAANEKFRLRQAYVKLAYPAWDILAGQTWDFFSPLGPSTLNFGYGWRAGNIGDRHPQMLLTKRFDDVLDGDLSTTFGLLDIQNDAQEKRGIPLSGLYAKYTNEAFDMPYMVSLGGIWGQIEDTTSGALADGYLDVWAATLGSTLKINNYISLKAEGFLGANLAAFRSTNNSSIDGHKSLRSRGGFVQMTIKPVDKNTINIGLGVDDVYGLNQVSSANWDYNWFRYINYNYALTKNLTLGIEYQNFTTKYINSGLLDTDTGTLNRIHTSFKYAF